MILVVSLTISALANLASAKNMKMSLYERCG